MNKNVMNNAMLTPYNEITNNEGYPIGQPTVETVAEWMGRYLTEEAARIVFGYIERHGYSASVDANDDIVIADMKEPESSIVAQGIDELLDCVINWNFELLLDDEVVGEFREQVIKDSEVLDDYFLRVGSRSGYYIGTPTVKELIAILSKLPEDYRVYNCGADNYLYLWAETKSITIDNERWLC